jgi:hypothetical protein
MATAAEWAAIHQAGVVREIQSRQSDREVREDCTQALFGLAAYFEPEDENPYSVEARLSSLLTEIAHAVNRIRTSGYSFIDPPMPLTDTVIVEWFGEEPPRGSYRW